ncbi:MAG: SGNH/GDSL hydrolase family protein [Acutalibacteraceae bacterium]
MKKVLLLGDSIRLNYMPVVFRELSDAAVVFGPDDNCRYCKYTLWNLDEWMTEERYDVIHFNCGIWDLTRKQSWNYENFTDAYEYKRDLSKIADALKSVSDRLIVATTTPVKTDSEFHKNADILRYNSVLLKMAEEKGIYVDDLFSLINSDREKYICGDNIHLSKEGIKAAGTQVANAIRKYL